MVVVEGTEAFIRLPHFSQGNVFADDFHDVVGFFDLLDPVVRQGPPMGQESACDKDEE